jgi:hypothetical protein
VAKNWLVLADSHLAIFVKYSLCLKFGVVKGTVPLTTPLMVNLAHFNEIDFLCGRDLWCYEKHCIACSFLGGCPMGLGGGNSRLVIDYLLPMSVVGRGGPVGQVGRVRQVGQVGRVGCPQCNFGAGKRFVWGVDIAAKMAAASWNELEEGGSDGADGADGSDGADALNVTLVTGNVLCVV